MFFSGREERLRKKEEKLAEAWRKKLLRRWKKDRKRRAGLSAGGPAPRKEGTGLLGPAAFLAGASAGKPRKRPGGCGGEDPCELFSNICFPVNEFFPPSCLPGKPHDYEGAKCCCSK